MTSRLSTIVGAILLSLLTGRVPPASRAVLLRGGQEQEEVARLVFDPPLDTAIAWSLEAAVDLELEHSELVSVPYWHGREFLLWSGLAEEGDTIELGWAARFEEVLRSVDEDRPLEFERRWEELALDLVRKGEELIEPKDVHLASALEGETIRYSWEPEAMIYDPTRQNGKGRLQIEILESLDPLVPVVPVLIDRLRADAQEWRVDPTQLLRSFWPGGFGTLGYGERLGSWPLPELPPLPELWLDDIEGKVCAKLEGRRKVAGEDLLVVLLEFDVSSAIEAQEWLPIAMKSVYFEWIDYRGQGITWRWKGSGTLLWSEKTNGMESISLDGDLSVDYELTANFNPAQPRSERRGASLELVEEWRGRATMRLGRHD